MTESHSLPSQRLQAQSWEWQHIDKSKGENGMPWHHRVMAKSAAGEKLIVLVKSKNLPTRTPRQLGKLFISTPSSGVSLGVFYLEI